MAATNPCSKRVTPETAYEVWQTDNGTWTYWVLKKYQAPEQEAKNPYARWYCAVKSPFTHGSFSYGDMYVSEVKNGTHLVPNPLAHTDEQTTGKENRT